MPLAHVLGFVFRTSKLSKRVVSSSSASLFHQVFYDQSTGGSCIQKEVVNVASARPTSNSLESMLDKHIAFVGAGQMAEALAKVSE